MQVHIRHTRNVMRLIKVAGATLKFLISALFKDHDNYLDHVVRPGHLDLANHTPYAISGIQTPNTGPEICSFLEFCNVFRKIVLYFAWIDSLSSKRLWKTQDKVIWNLTDKELAALATLTKLLLASPILTLPKNYGQEIIDTNACDQQVGCVLLQKQPNQNFILVEYWPSVLNTTETNRTKTHREFFAVVWAKLLSRTYLEGPKFLVRTEHHALRSRLNLAEATKI